MIFTILLAFFFGFIIGAGFILWNEPDEMRVLRKAHTQLETELGEANAQLAKHAPDVKRSWKA